MQIKLSWKKQRIILVSTILLVIVFLSYISIQSFWADIHYRRAKQLARDVKNWKKAAIEYEKAISISPGNAEYHDEAGQLYSKLSILYQDDELFNKAVFHFKTSYQLNPYNAWAHYHLAWSYWSKKMYPEAVLESKKAVELDPNNATYHWQLAVIYEKMGRLEKAIDEYREVLRIMPGQGKAKEAIKRVKRKIQKNLKEITH